MPRQHPRASKKMLTLPVILICIIILVLAVRLYYNSGPVYELGDEGIYLNTLSQSLIFHSNPYHFFAYTGVNFSNVNQTVFNPANIFKFYSGFLFPELAFMRVFGYSGWNAIYYVILTSVVEVIFTFLIIDSVVNRRAALIGAFVMAFFPLDVMLSVRVIPLVPMAALLTVSIYLFIRAEKAKASKQRCLLYLLAGLFIGLAYVTHPEGVILLPFLLLYLISKALKNIKLARSEVKVAALLMLGAFIGFSTTGILYLTTANNFFLYPQVDHAIFLYQYMTQSHANFSITKSIVLSYTTGNPYSYIGLMLKIGLSNKLFYIEHNFLYFSIYGYLSLIFGMLMLFKSKISEQKLFFYMLIFFILTLSLFPTHISISGNKIILLIVNSDPIYGSILVLPTVVLVAWGIDYMMTKGTRKRYLMAVAIALLVICIAISIVELNYDSGLYRNSMYDVNAFVSYISSHSGGMYYASSLFVQEVDDISGYKYQSAINPLFPCFDSAIPSGTNTYLVVGGTLSISWSPSVINGYDMCVEDRLTNPQTVYTIPNPYLSSAPLEIIKNG